MPILPTNQTPRALAFTGHGTGRMAEIVVDIYISTPFQPGVTPPPEPIPISAKALWDTGATNCAITKAKADEIGLASIGKAEVFHADGKNLQDVYLLNLHLPQKLIIPMVRATECKSARGNFDFIIGMDIITLGDFALTNVGGISVVSFRIPPIRTIDYVKEIDSIKAMQSVNVGRNDPCPCKSGKKYKQCHGR